MSCFGNEKQFLCLYFRFSLTFLRECRTLGPGHGVSELHGEGLHDVDNPLEVELVGVVGGVGEEGGAPDDRLRGVKVAIFYPVFLPPLIFFIFFWYSFLEAGGRQYHQRLPWSEPMMEAQDGCSHSTRQDG